MLCLKLTIIISPEWEICSKEVIKECLFHRTTPGGCFWKENDPFSQRLLGSEVYQSRSSSFQLQSSEISKTFEEFSGERLWTRLMTPFPALYFQLKINVILFSGQQLYDWLFFKSLGLPKTVSGLEKSKF